MRPVEAAACPVARPHGQLLILILIVILLGLGFLEIKSKITIKSGACAVGALKVGNETRAKKGKKKPFFSRARLL